MVCKGSSQDTSDFVDSRLRGEKLADYLHHISQCEHCRTELHEVESLGEELRRMGSVFAPINLHQRVMSRVRELASPRPSIAYRLYRQLRPCFSFRASRLQVASYSIGSVASVLLFFITLVGLSPIPGPRVTYAATEVTPVNGTLKEYLSYNNLEPAESDFESDTYQLPLVTASSSLVSFSHIAYNDSGHDGASALIEIAPDGRGRIVRMIQQSSNPKLVPFLEWSLSKRPFKPAMISGQAVPTRIVLLLEKMDVAVARE